MLNQSMFHKELKSKRYYTIWQVVNKSTHTSLDTSHQIKDVGTKTKKYWKVLDFGRSNCVLVSNPVQITQFVHKKQIIQLKLDIRC